MEISVTLTALQEQELFMIKPKETGSNELSYITVKHTTLKIIKPVL